MRQSCLGVLLSLSLAALAGCSDDEERALVRFAHFSPDAPAVDIRVDGERVVSSLEFRELSDYLEVDAGARRIEVSPAGQSTVVLAATAELEKDGAYTVAASNFVSSIDALVLVDELEERGSGARVRFVHAAPDVPAVDIAVAGGAVVFPNVAFRGIADYAELPAGTYNLEVRLAGTGTVALPLPGIRLDAGKTYTAVAVGSLRTGDVGALLVEDAN